MSRGQKTALTAVVVLGLWPAWGHAADTAPTTEQKAAPAQELSQIDARLFNSVDLNKDKRISRAEIIVFADVAFVLLDSDKNGSLTLQEAEHWDPGYRGLAERLGKMDQLNSAKAEVFKFRDLNGDGRVDHDEYSVASLYDFYKADMDHDGVLTQDEFIGHYRIVKAVHAVFE